MSNAHTIARGTESPSLPTQTLGPAAAEPRAATRPGKMRTRRLTARLLAARLEDDNSIHLRIADPGNDGASLQVALPDIAGVRVDGSGQTGEARMLAARAAFIDSIVAPPFEGYALLYGIAHLTLAEPAETGGLPRVLDFVALDDTALSSAGATRAAA